MISISAMRKLKFELMADDPLFIIHLNRVHGLLPDQDSKKTSGNLIIMVIKPCWKFFCLLQNAVVGCAMVGSVLAASPHAQLSLSPLAGANNVTGEVVVVLQNPGPVVGLQMDFEPVAGRFEVESYGLGGAATAAGLQLRSSPLTNGQTRVVLFSTTNRRLGEGEIIKVRGIRRNQTDSLEHGLSMRAVTIADDRGLLREFAFAPYIGLSQRAGQPVPGQPVVFDGLIFPTDQTSGGVEVRVNGRLVAQAGEGRFAVTWTPLEPGQAFVTAMARGGGAAALPLPVTVAGGSLNTYQKWRGFHFPSNPSGPTGPGQPLGDADQDTVLNLWEYFRGSAPNAGDDGLPVVENTVVSSGTENFVALKVRVRAIATDFEVVGEASGSLGFPAASTSPALVVSREGAGDFQVITLRDTVPIRSSATRFLRARVRPLAP